MHAIVRKALRTLFRFCLPMLLTFGVTALHSVTEEAWEMLESDHFQTYYQPDETHPQDIADIAEDFYPHINRLIDGIEIGKIEIWMCKTQQQFQAAAHAPIQDWAVGCAFPLSLRIVIKTRVLSLIKSSNSPKSSATKLCTSPLDNARNPQSETSPYGLLKGLRSTSPGEWAPHRHEVMFEHILSRSIIPLADLTERFPSAERGHSWLMRRA